MSADSQAAIDRFVDAVWLEDGLSANTLAAYRRDLEALADWLSQSSGTSFNAVQEMHLQAYFAARHSLSKACLLYTSPSPRDLSTSRMPSSA